MSDSISTTSIERVNGSALLSGTDLLAVEEPLEILLEHGPPGDRKSTSIAVTMRTPGNDLELAVGFLVTESVIHEPADIDWCGYAEKPGAQPSESAHPFVILRPRSSKNVVHVKLAAHVRVGLENLSRNFYTTSSCGICGKTSLRALETRCPPRPPNRFSIPAETLRLLPARLREAQAVFDRTGGLHGAALFDAEGSLVVLREDVGRHNAVDKLIGNQFRAGRLPLRNRLLMLSGRASFELLQKALMGGVPMVAAVGAPSSLAVQVARRFDIALIGFLRDTRFNVYHGAEHLSGLGKPLQSADAALLPELR